jgi:hypothetical protein
LDSAKSTYALVNVEDGCGGKIAKTKKWERVYKLKKWVMELAAKKKYSHRNSNNQREIKTIECKKI